MLGMTACELKSGHMAEGWLKVGLGPQHAFGPELISVTTSNLTAGTFGLQTACSYGLGVSAQRVAAHFFTANALAASSALKQLGLIAVPAPSTNMAAIGASVGGVIAILAAALAALCAWHRLRAPVPLIAWLTSSGKAASSGGSGAREALALTPRGPVCRLQVNMIAGGSPASCWAHGG